MSKTWGFFFVAQDMVLSHRAKFMLIENFFRVKAISTGLFCKLYDNFREYGAYRAYTSFSNQIALWPTAKCSHGP